MRAPMVIVLALALLVAPIASADGAAQQDIRICELVYGDLAKVAEFRAVVDYTFTTAKSGQPGELHVLGSKPEGEPFRPRLAEFERCLQGWVLRPNTSYRLILTWGPVLGPTVYELRPKTGDGIRIEIP